MQKPAFIKSLIVALAICAIAWLGQSTRAALAAEVNLSGEAQTLNAFGNELLALDKKCAELGRKTDITRAEFDAVRASADRLKQRVTTVQQSFRSIIDKLKGAKQWDNFDTQALQIIKKERVRGLVRNEGGAKSFLESAATQTGGLTNEIDAVVDSLRAKVRQQTSSNGFVERGLGGQFIRASFAPAETAMTANPAVMAAGRGKCLFAKARTFVSGLVNGGFPTEDAILGECKACGVAFEDCGNPTL
jgi:hypothetical protein